MQSTDSPTKVVLPFANAGGRSTLPVASQIGITDGAASLTDGFPPLTRTPLTSGGVPPNGLEMNGILYLLSAGVWWLQAGGSAKWDGTFSTAIGGYPLGAVVQSSDNTGWWRSTAENNTTDPDAGGAGWVPHFGYGQAAQSLTNVNVTLTALQALKSQIVLSGVLSANVNLIFPPGYQSWTVVNNTTGAFNITAKTAAGSGVVLGSGPNMLFGDGTNIANALSAYVAYAAFTGANQSLASPGFQKFPGGLIERWGSVSVGDAATGNNTAAVTFATAFPTALLSLSLTVQDQNPANNLVVSFKDPTASGFTLQFQETAAAVQAATVHYVARGH